MPFKKMLPADKAAKRINTLIKAGDYKSVDEVIEDFPQLKSGKDLVEGKGEVKQKGSGPAMRKLPFGLQG